MNIHFSSSTKQFVVSKAKAVGKTAFADPLLHQAFQDYIDDTKKFKAKLKKRGVTSTKDLKKAFADDGLEDLIL